MRAHYFQHVPFEGLGAIESWLRSPQGTVTCTRFFEQPSLPKVGDLDLLIVMGGPMSANDEVALPWLKAEKRFIREAIEAEKPVLGVCLGAQLIANALGAAVYPNREKEIGWFPIQSVPNGSSASRFAFPLELPVFHWHGETFDLPAGAQWLARSGACENQAFQLGRRVMGLQFHLEVTPASVRQLIDNCRAELDPPASRYVQTETQMLAVPDRVFAVVNSLMNDLLSFLTGE